MMIKFQLINIILLIPSSILGQPDSNRILAIQSGLESRLSVEQAWDDFLAKQGNWRDIVKDNKKYFLDCKQSYVFEYLTKIKKIDVDTLLDKSYSVFAHGCRCGNHFLVNKGLLKNTDINKSYYFNMTPLMLAIESQDTTTINLIINKCPNLLAVNDNGENILHLSVVNNIDTAFIIKLINSKVDLTKKNTLGYDVLEKSYYWGRDEVFRFIFNYCAKTFDSTYWRGSKLFEMAIISGDSALLDKVFSLAKIEVTRNQNIEYFKLVEEFVEYYNLLNKYRDAPEDTSSRLYNTLDLDISIISTLISHGFDINTTDSIGQNLLFKCSGISPVANFLIKNGIEINKTDAFGRTALQLYINQIIRPPRYEFGISLKEPNRDYTDELNLLRLYVENGAVVGQKGENGWHYIYNMAKQGNNHFLLQFLKRKYSEYIK